VRKVRLANDRADNDVEESARGTVVRPPPAATSQEVKMRDMAEVQGVVMTARLMRTMDEREAKERNALSVTRPGLALKAGDVVTVVETFDKGSAFLVEFNGAAKTKKNACDWMGVVYPAEIEVISTIATKR
jgi:hypothetical protein